MKVIGEFAPEGEDSSMWLTIQPKDEEDVEHFAKWFPSSMNGTPMKLQSPWWYTSKGRTCNMHLPSHMEVELSEIETVSMPLVFKQKVEAFEAGFKKGKFEGEMVQAFNVEKCLEKAVKKVDTVYSPMEQYYLKSATQARIVKACRDFAKILLKENPAATRL